VAAASAVDGVIVATGEHVDPAELGPLPNHVVAERFVAQRDVLAGCYAVVSHAGSGTVLDALLHGLPQVCLPLGGDQTLNARRCAELGSGIVLRHPRRHHPGGERRRDGSQVSPCGRAAAGRNPGLS
jgi:UDP:flavonoid glycosyltransferase YjiC (YdhE family)